MSKPYLIMLPGWGMKTFIWDKISKLLLKDFELVFIEWDNIQSVGEFKDRVVNIIKQKQISEFSILGWSLGSLVAEDIVLDNSCNVKQLILIGGTGCFVKHKDDGYNIGWDKRIVERMKSRLYKKPHQVLCDFYNLMFSKAEKQNGWNNEFLQVVESNQENSSIDSLAVGLDYLIQKDLRSKLSYINIPLLIIQGAEDNICSLEACEYIKNKISHCNIKILEQLGHIPFFTNVNACYSIISEFTSKNI